MPARSDDVAVTDASSSAIPTLRERMGIANARFSSPLREEVSETQCVGSPSTHAAKHLASGF